MTQKSSEDGDQVKSQPDTTNPNQPGGKPAKQTDKNG